MRFMSSLTAFGIFALIVFSFLSCGRSHSGQVEFGQILKSPGNDWLTYGGDYASKRYSPLGQINRGNVSKLSPHWIYRLEGEDGNLRVTPLVYRGIMYITNAYEIQALDAANGKRLWYWRAPEYPDTWMNRGAALLGDKVFFITGNCVLAALDSMTGKLIWSKQYADPNAGYGCTVAPLALKDRIIVGVSGGYNGVRGFVAAFSPENGKELWRLWTISIRGEPAAETWGLEPEHKIGGAATWVSGSYDPDLNLLYWGTGAPWPEFEGHVRPGDNLYSNCMLAINPDTGKLKWHFQFTPHDLHGWDATEIPVLVDTLWRGRPRKLLMQANRNGFFYVLDRVTGEFLNGGPFAKVTWAEGLTAKGRPIESAGKNVTWESGVSGICPGFLGATNWMSPSYNPETGLFYVVTLEACDMKRGRHYLRAINPQTAKVRWEYLMPGSAPMYAGTLSTAGGLVFAGDDTGNMIALDAKTGAMLWQFAMKRPVFASPMTYAANGKQYIAIAAGPEIFSFSLPD